MHGGRERIAEDTEVQAALVAAAALVVPTVTVVTDPLVVPALVVVPVLVVAPALVVVPVLVVVAPAAAVPTAAAAAMPYRVARAGRLEGDPSDVQVAVADVADRDRLPRMGSQFDAAEIGGAGDDDRPAGGAAGHLQRARSARIVAVDGVVDAVPCGSLRRFSETVGDVDIVVATTDPAAVHAAVLECAIVISGARGPLPVSRERAMSALSSMVYRCVFGHEE